MESSSALSVFAKFPKFTTLTLENREAYEALISNFTLHSDFSFPMLMTWWSMSKPVQVSILNGNIVIKYFMLEDMEATGYCLIGTHRVDSSLCFLFDYLNSENLPPRLVHVPEFVIRHVRYPELFAYNQEVNHSEYVINISTFKSIDRLAPRHRIGSRRFASKIHEDEVTVRSLDMSLESCREEIFSYLKEWPVKGAFNYVNKLERECLDMFINQAEDLDIHNVCLYVKGRLVAFLLYQYTFDSDYIIINFGRFDYEISNIFEYSTFMFGKWFDSQGIKKANIDSDTGHDDIRSIKLTLGPLDVLRKYTVRSSTQGQSGIPD